MIPNLIAGLLAPVPSAIAGDYESIQTVTVGAGGAASVTFSSIPSTYTHLQIRGISRSSRATYGNDSSTVTFNADTGANYSRHQLLGDGASASATGTASTNGININSDSATGAPTGTFGVSIIDILDYTNSNKYKTLRWLGGSDINGLVAGYGGITGIVSGLWMNTSAISSITITPLSPNYVQYSQFALYGVK